MHGRPRQSVRAEVQAATPQQQEAARRKVEGLRRLQEQVLRCHQTGEYSTTALQLSAELLSRNADVTFAWNYRKKSFCHRLKQVLGGESDAAVSTASGNATSSSTTDSSVGSDGGSGSSSKGKGGEQGEGSGGGNSVESNKSDDAAADAIALKLSSAVLSEDEAKESCRKMVEVEFKVVEAALQANPKSYGAWHHRKWLFTLGGLPSTFPPPASTPGVASRPHADVAVLKHLMTGRFAMPKDAVAREFRLLKKLLMMDSRNFHGWDYRRFMVEVAHARPDDELQFASDKINENFSNYSAWHYRSKLLPAAYPQLERERSVVDEEYELVRQAFFTEPEDQSGWMYFSWLLGRTVPPPAPSLVAALLRLGESGLEPREDGSGERGRREGEDGLSVLLSFSEPVKGVTVREVDGEGRLVQVEECRAASEAVSLSAGEPSGSGGRSREGREEREETWTCEPLGATGDGFGLVWRAWRCGRLRKDGRGKSCITLQVGRSEGDKEEGKESGEEQGTGIEAARGRMMPHSYAVSLQMGEEGVQGLVVEIRSQDKDKGAGGGEEGGGASGDGWRLEVVDREIGMCRELLELEPNSKWGMLTLARLVQAKSALKQAPRYGAQSSREDGVLGGRDKEGNEEEGEVCKLYGLLRSTDTFHSAYYSNQIAAMAAAKGTPSPDTRPVTTTKAGALHVDLSAHALSSLVPSQALMEATSLNVSSNAFRTTQGFEVLQSVTAIDLSHNRIATSAALRPLALLPCLLSLNLSHNCLGESGFDPARYLLPTRNEAGFRLQGGGGGGEWQRQVAVEGEPSGASSQLREALGDLQLFGRLKDLDLSGNRVLEFDGFSRYMGLVLPRCRLTVVDHCEN